MTQPGTEWLQMLAWASVMLVLHWNLCAAEHLCHACMRGVSGWIRVASSVECSPGQGRSARQHSSQRVWQQWLLVLPGMQAAMGPLACRPKDIKQCAESQLVVASCRSDLPRQACAGRSPTPLTAGGSQPRCHQCQIGLSKALPTATTLLMAGNMMLL